MITLIASIILICSLAGMGMIVFRKIPVLVKLPEVVESPEKKIILSLKQKIKEAPFIKDFSYEIFLQKLLYKIKILTLKTENKTTNLLQELKEKSKKKKIAAEDNYWEEIQKSTKK